MQYDLFISYSRIDNDNDRVTDLIEIIKQDYLDFSKEELRCFFDKEDIKVSEDWEHRILQGLRDSHLLLIILTPNYLSSKYCEWEIIEYLKYEYSRGVAGDGVTQVYFLEIPGLDTDDFKEKAAQWLNKIGGRQRIDFRPWNEDGSESLKNLEVKKRLKELRESLRKRIVRKRIISNVEGNIPAPNPKFVGRETEMKNLHKFLDTGKLGVITAVHGVGGLGKTAIAYQYAWAFGDFYSGGAWYISCANQKNLATVIKSLSSDLSITFFEDEQKDEIKGAKRILNILKNQAEEKAKKSNEIVKPAVLLILDNVDYSELIEPPESDLISGKEWLKVLVTTRMGPKELHTDGTDMSLLTIDELPFEDALSLIESYQPYWKFANKSEKEKAGEIVELLGGFTLAIEVSALYLKQMDGRCSCADFVELLKREGIEEIGSMTKKNISHSKLISVTLKPTLDNLPPNELAMLEYASLLPPDSIPLPWLKALIEKEYPEFSNEDEIGKDNPWINAINHLLSIRLFKVVEMDEEGKNPRIVKMHRLVQYNLNQNDSKKEFKSSKIILFLKTQSDILLGYEKNKKLSYEMSILNKAIFYYLNLGVDVADIANQNVEILYGYGAFDVARTISYEAIKIGLRKKNKFNPTLTTSYSNLAAIEKEFGNLKQAKQLMKKVIKIDENDFKANNPYLSTSYSNLALIELELGRLKSAKNLLLKAINLDSRNLKKSDPLLGIRYTNLASVEKALKNFEEARFLTLKALKLFKKKFGDSNNFVALSLVNWAILEQCLKNFEKAKKLILKALKISESILSEKNHELARRLYVFAMIERDLKNYKNAYKIIINAITIAESDEAKNLFQLAKYYDGLGLIYFDLQDYKNAEKYFKEALCLRESLFPDGHKSIKVSLSHLNKVKKIIQKIKL